ncbi:MAG: symporter small accessory protein [Desulfonatronovibrionaceae bacterium]
MMIGLGSLQSALAFWLCIAAAGLCVIYGICKWNTEGPADRRDREEK